MVELARMLLLLAGEFSILFVGSFKLKTISKRCGLKQSS